MKVCILSTANLKHMTLISLYTRILEEKSIDYDVIYVDKYGDFEFFGDHATLYPYRITVNRKLPRIIKLFKYIRFKKFATKILSKNNYDIIIIWNSFTALIFGAYLSKNYSGKYIINIRDYCYERIQIIYRMMKRVIENCMLSTISSEGFKVFLPPFNYLTIHSLNKDVLKKCEKRLLPRSISQPLRIGFIGYVRFFEMDKRLIDALGNDNRYVLKFIGEGSNVLESYAMQKGYNNVLCVGRFEPDDTADLLTEIDIINNLYGNGKIELDTALSIKLYYAAYIYLPILVCDRTYMSEIAEKLGIGFTVKETSYDTLGDTLYKWYFSTDFSDLQRRCSNFLAEIESKNQELEQILMGLFQSR